jgi:riboflavin transporter FmnP
MTTSNSRTRSLWIALTIVAVVGFAAFMFPAFIIRPFRYQAPRALMWAMAIRQRAPIVSLLCAFVSLLLIAMLWRSSNKWRKAVLSLAAFAVILSAVMSRLNYFEWMFHPVDSARFDAESSSKLGADEMILAVRYGADSRAYPIREMAYHHILNDVVGGVPIAVTY